jgi:hypothetical protein
MLHAIDPARRANFILAPDATIRVWRVACCFLRDEIIKGS